MASQKNPCVTSDAPASKPTQAEPSVMYHRLEIGKRRSRNGKTQEPVLKADRARVVAAAPGLVLTGFLVDCFERPPGLGTVVIDTLAGPIAVRSPLLTCLMIEHAPCLLELIAIPCHDHHGVIQWDWEAYEISPQGPRILASDPPKRPVVTEDSTTP